MTHGSAASFMTADGFRAYLAEHGGDLFGGGDAKMCPVAAYLCSMRPGSTVGTVTASVAPESGSQQTRACLALPKWAREFIRRWDGRSRVLSGDRVLSLFEKWEEKEKRSGLTAAG